MEINNIEHIIIKNDTDYYLDDAMEIVWDKIKLILSENDSNPTSILNINSILSELKTNLSKNLYLVTDDPEYFDYIILREKIEDE